MNLCSRCLQAVGLTVRYPKLLSVIKWCDHCNESRSSVSAIDVVKQSLVVRS